MKQWTDINQFRRVVSYIKDGCEFNNTPLPQLLFRGTVKLHGSNVGICREKGAYTPQGRTTQLTLDNDNYGFARWLQTKLENTKFKEDLDGMFDRFQQEEDDVITIFGEWCGKGIQKNVAMNQLPSKKFVIFAAHVNDNYVEISSSVNIDDDDIGNVLEAPVFFVGVDFNDPASVLETFEKLTMTVDAECPYGKLYGISGIGEGLVWTCVEHPTNTNLFFKTKGPSHAKNDKTHKVVTIDPEKLEKISDVIDYVLTAGRLQQGLEHIDQLEMTSMGQYLKWIGQDVQKEELDTIETNGLVWKDIAKQLNIRARNYFIKCIDESTF